MDGWSVPLVAIIMIMYPKQHLCLLNYKLSPIVICSFKKYAHKEKKLQLSSKVKNRDYNSIDWVTCTNAPMHPHRVCLSMHTLCITFKEGSREDVELSGPLQLIHGDFCKPKECVGSPSFKNTDCHRSMHNYQYSSGEDGENILHFILARQSNRRPKSRCQTQALCVYYCHLFRLLPRAPGSWEQQKRWTVMVAQQNIVPSSAALRGRWLKHWTNSWAFHTFLMAWLPLYLFL